MVVTLVATPTFPRWSASADDIRLLATRIIVLAMVGLGTAILAYQLRLERACARSVQDDAARLADLGRVRAEFIDSVSHDLRTPLTAAHAGLGMLMISADNHLEQDERNLLQNVQRNIVRLGVLVDDLLTLDQIEANQLAIERKVLDLCQVVNDAAAALAPLFEGKRQQLDIQFSGRLLTEGSPRRLEQAVTNLLANANEHTPAGTHITVSGDERDGHIHLAVRDTGPGIPVHEQQAVFQPFYRGRHELDGVGLGLANASAIVRLHKGRIWVESQPGVGTAFHIVLPCLTDEEAYAEPAHRG